LSYLPQKLSRKKIPKNLVYKLTKNTLAKVYTVTLFKDCSSIMQYFLVTEMIAFIAKKCDHVSGSRAMLFQLVMQ